MTDQLTQLTLNIHERNLARLEQRVAMYAGAAPIYLLEQMDYAKDEIAKIKAQLEELGA